MSKSSTKSSSRKEASSLILSLGTPVFLKTLYKFRLIVLEVIKLCFVLHLYDNSKSVWTYPFFEFSLKSFKNFLWGSEMCCKTRCCVIVKTTFFCDFGWKKLWKQLVFTCGMVFFMVFFSLSSYAQRDTSRFSWRNNIDTLRFAEIENESFKITPYVAPSYSPELSVLFTAGGLITFKAQKYNNLLNLSSIPFSVGYSTNGAFTLNVQNVIYWGTDQIRTTGEFIIRDMPDNYWGVGYDNGLDAEKSAEKTGYKRRYWRFYERMMVRSWGDFFAGGMVDFNGTKASDLNPNMLVDENVLRDGTQLVNTGLGLVLEYDTRDFMQNAYEGIYLSAGITFFEEAFGGNSSFRAFEFDYRQYQTLVRPRRTLAWQLKSKYCFGNSVPWSDMAMLGGPFNMRGYTLGRFRDKHMNTITVEYRHMFKRKTINKKGNYNSRLGYVVWAAAGSISPSYQFNYTMLPNVGAGLRFEIQPKMNVRFDYGFGKGESGAYVTISEAF